ncbi:J domain-containing protein [Amphibalanus amphitrite]|uniref:J domain-containing protein n=1 Tax=Amphibalanus amphitrite TaxID=1232801 RepID=A0A6A4VU16_AMPAM|nr:J domain-containing protein-like [Amphibalanus amphitrite]XP_043195680.1 J domain-containing protein-like [Amphibalanus amphitrite]XP_043195681.1 J domain-containing protein-like [Amphibalanus amphitrite]KAF0298306.1 J domain-containing protein [Amphibalanus amphitrite]
MDAILKPGPKEEDLYDLLNCHPSSTVEQIQTEYKILALQFHPDKNPDDTTAEKRFQQLQFAKETLCDEERRATYDKWRASGLTIPFKEWLAMRDSVKTSMHWATPKTADRMLPPGAGSSDESTSALRGGHTADESIPRGGNTVGQSIRSDRPYLAQWRRSEGSDLVRKFRNYEI